MKEKKQKLIDITTVKFLLVGVINTLVGTGTMFGLYNCLGSFCLGGFFQLVLTIAAGDRWAVWVPAGLGVLGLALSFLFLLAAVS